MQYHLSVSHLTRGVQLGLALLFSPLVAQAAPLMVQNFSTDPTWGVYGYKYGPGSSTLPNPSVSQGAYGTIDTYNSSTPSAGLRLSVDSTNAGTGNWEVGATSGLVNVSANLVGIPAGELTPGKVSISFDCWANYSRPITVAIESYSANNLANRTGRSEAVVYPAAAEFYQRKVLELSDFTTTGGTAFQPNSPYYRILFIISSSKSPAWPKASPIEVRVDNVNISTPALYVDAVNGRDWYYGYYPDGGRTEARAFQTIYGAAGVAQAGDIILVRERPTPYRNYDFYSGTNINYNSNSAAASFAERGGSPARWIVLKNYPGEQPVIESSGFQCVSIGGSSNPLVDTSYIEVRGFELVGVAQQLDLADPGELSTFVPNGPGEEDDQVINNNTIKGTGQGGANTSGVFVRGGNMTKRPHHIRVADNVVHDLSGAGVAAIGADWITIENNIIYNTSWWTNSATSGISILTPYDFPGTSGEYRLLIAGNEVYGNECRKEWVRSGQLSVFSDGNGIILDSFRGNAGNSSIAQPAYRARALVQNNLSYKNGGSGIHAYVSDRIDIVNNSAYSNSRRSAEQGGYGEIYAYNSNDVRIYNNIMVADAGKPLNACAYSADVNPADRRNPRLTGPSAGVTFRHNVYKFSDTDTNGAAPGGVTKLYPVTNNTPVNIRLVSQGYQQWQETADRQKEVARLNQNADAALSEDSYRTYALVWNGATNTPIADFTLAPNSDARQRGTQVIGNANAAELSFLPSLDLAFQPRAQGTLAAPTAKIPDAGALESPASQ